MAKKKKTVEPFTFAEYLEVARAFLWTANQALISSSKPGNLEVRRDFSDKLVSMIEALDDVPLKVLKDVAVVGVVGLVDADPAATVSDLTSAGESGNTTRERHTRQ